MGLASDALGLNVHDISHNPVTSRRKWLHLAMGEICSLDPGGPHGQHCDGDRTDPRQLEILEKWSENKAKIPHRLDVRISIILLAYRKLTIQEQATRLWVDRQRIRRGPSAKHGGKFLTTGSRAIRFPGNLRFSYIIALLFGVSPPEDGDKSVRTGVSHLQLGVAGEGVPGNLLFPGESPVRSLAVGACNEWV